MNNFYDHIFFSAKEHEEGAKIPIRRGRFFSFFTLTRGFNHTGSHFEYGAAFVRLPKTTKKDGENFLTGIGGPAAVPGGRGRQVQAG